MVEPALREEDAGPGNRIHVDDLVAAIVAAIDRQSAQGVFNVTDGDYASTTTYLKLTAAVAGIEPPALISRAEAREQIAALEASNAEQAQMMADGFADAKEQSAQLAEARAEIDRLRPAAEAFFLAEKKRRAAARARAAKVTP